VNLWRLEDTDLKQWFVILSLLLREHLVYSISINTLPEHLHSSWFALYLIWYAICIYIRTQVLNTRFIVVFALPKL